MDGKTAHGSTPYLGDNAIEKLLTVIQKVKQISDHELEIPEDLKSVLRSSVDFLLVNPELNDSQQKAARQLFDFPTVSLNILQGGVKINVVPDSADAAIDIRFTPGIDIDELKKHVVDLIKSSDREGITHEFQVGTGYYESPKSIFVEQFSNIIRDVTKSTPDLKILTGGTDAISMKNFQGVPCLGFGSGLKGQAHTPDEHVSIENLVMAAKVYTLFPLLYKP
jgi:succinyl-diaminopimelate desuccinylase